VGRHDDLGNGVLAGEGSFEIAFEQRSEGFRVLPFGMLRRQRLDPVESEQQLEIKRLFRPERAVIVEVAMRSAGLTKPGPPWRVTLVTNSIIARLLAPSFHDGSASTT
jgi:hypothetical protein